MSSVYNEKKPSTMMGSVVELLDHHHNRKSFFQLAGHKESFRAGARPNTILKRSIENEERCLKELMKDNSLAPFVPRFYGLLKLHDDGHIYLELQDLIAGFHAFDVSVMDVKMGCRTYHEEDLNNALRDTRLRPDMYDKMLEIDENEPTNEERLLKAITKPRYMIWRETISSTANLAFRIEAMRLKDGTIDKEFKTTKSEEQVAKAFMRYASNRNIRLAYLKRLYDLRQALMQSHFFLTHELIGCSLLFVHSDTEANIWLIDFAKTRPLPDSIRITHWKKWELGNHEDGFLLGVDNLIRILESITFARVTL